MKIHRFIHVQRIDFRSPDSTVPLFNVDSVVSKPEKTAVKANVVAGSMVVFTSLFVIRYTVFR